MVLGRTTPLTSVQSAEIGSLLRPPKWLLSLARNPWPETMGLGYFGGEPVTITHAEFLVVAEVSADPAEQVGRRRHPFRRIRHDG